MSAEDNKLLVRRFFDEVCNGRKLNVANEILSSSYQYHDPSVPSGPPGPEAQKSALAVYQTAFPDARWDVDELFAADGDRIVARWRGSGTQRSELQGIPPTGKHVSVDGIWIFQIKNGKIAESWLVWDTFGMMKALGVVPEPESARMK